MTCPLPQPDPIRRPDPVTRTDPDCAPDAALNTGSDWPTPIGSVPPTLDTQCERAGECSVDPRGAPVKQEGATNRTPPGVYPGGKLIYRSAEPEARATRRRAAGADRGIRLPSAQVEASRV